MQLNPGQDPTGRFSHLLPGFSLKNASPSQPGGKSKPSSGFPVRTCLICHTQEMREEGGKRGSRSDPREVAASQKPQEVPELEQGSQTAGLQEA